jgi:hypothetical protein
LHSYTNLSDLSFLQVPGYIAGVTNPMFEAREEWWDLLCVLDLPQVCVPLPCTPSAIALLHLRTNRLWHGLTIPTSS